MSTESTKAALNRYFTRDAKKVSRVKRKNTKPEFEFKKICLAWLNEHGFSINVVESKAVYNVQAGMYSTGQTDPGFSDLVGVVPYFGVACFIELKAPGKRGTLKPHQRDFLLAKIKAGAFAVCVDSTALLSQLYNDWRGLRAESYFQASKDLLVSALPAVKELTDNLDDIL